MSVERIKEIPKTGVEAALGKLGKNTEVHTKNLENTFRIAQSIEGLGEEDIQKFSQICENVFLKNPDVAVLFERKSHLTA